MLHIADERLDIFRRIFVAVFESLIKQIVRNIVRFPEFVSFDDAQVDSVPDPLVTVILVASGSIFDFFRCQRKTDIQVNIAGETNLLELRVTSDSPQESFDIMEGILDNYSTISFYTVGDVVLNILEDPTIPFSPDNPLQTGVVTKRVFAAALLAFAALFGLLSVMKDTLKTEEDIEEKLDARSLGAISWESKNKSFRDLLNRKKRGLLISDPLAGFRFVESYRKLSSRIEYRMERAKQLLEDSRYKISDISSKVGYSDGNYFGKSFKKYSGLSPSEYREKMTQ